MKQEQQQQAQHLYFQTDLSKTEIANILGISRRSLHYWVREQGWDRIKLSCNNMPSLIVENCYMIMSKFTDSILSDLRSMRPITKPEADTLRSLALTIKNIKNRSSVNESLEMMTFFIEHVNSKDPEMALKIKPFISDYIANRAAVQPWQYMHEKFNDRGRIPVPEPEAPVANSKRTETQLDIEDIMAWADAEAETPTPTPSLSSREGAEGGRVNNVHSSAEGEIIGEAQSGVTPSLSSREGAEGGRVNAEGRRMESANVQPCQIHYNRAQRRQMARTAAKAAA